MPDTTRRESAAYRACLYLLLLSIYVFTDRALGCSVIECSRSDFSRGNTSTASVPLVPDPPPIYQS